MQNHILTCALGVCEVIKIYDAAIRRTHKIHSPLLAIRSRINTQRKKNVSRSRGSVGQLSVRVVAVSDSRGGWVASPLQGEGKGEDLPRRQRKQWMCSKKHHHNNTS